MKKTSVVKVAGWITAAVAGLMVSWASDKENKEQNDKNFEKYITKKEKGEDLLVLFNFYILKKGVIT